MGAAWIGISIAVGAWMVLKSEDRYREWYIAGRQDEERLRLIYNSVVEVGHTDQIETLAQVVAQQITERFPRGPVSIVVNDVIVSEWDGVDRIGFYSDL